MRNNHSKNSFAKKVFDKNTCEGCKRKNKKISEMKHLLGILPAMLNTFGR